MVILNKTVIFRFVKNLEKQHALSYLINRQLAEGL